MIRCVLRCVAVLIGTGLLACQARAGMISDHFVRTGPSEMIVAPFTSPSTSSVNTYGGFVEVIVSGVGNSLGTLLNDAFYGVPSGTLYDPQFYQLNIGWDAAPLFPFVGQPRNAVNFIVFDEGVDFVTPPYRPPYDPVNHTYHFAISVPFDAGHLAFGVSDGAFSDNGGQYNIQIWQLAVPEPSTIMLLAIGTLGLLGYHRRRRKEARSGETAAER
jgi:PEP-CTERM motif